MLLLIVFAFLAGIVTVLSPCILPLLPIILSSSNGKGKQKPIGVVLGFVASFTFFTLFLSTIVKLSGIPADSLRLFSILVLATFGVSLLIPQVQTKIEMLFSTFANVMPSGKGKTGFFGGFLIGLSLGLLWTPCVGPILASVISLAITGSVNAQAFFITIAYAIGTAIPMFMIMLAGSTALQKVPWLVKNTSKIQKIFGVLMILTALGIFFNVDRTFQTWVLTTFPNYGVGLTKFEDNSRVKNALDQTNQQGAQSSSEKNMIGKSLSDVVVPKGEPAPELIQGGEWFNSPPLTVSDLKGKVVLVDFWTYSCINCQRTFPYLRTWWEKYEDKGLVIVGVHAPEFAFEREAKNVSKAIRDFGINYPVMQDNNFETWRAYENRYWPAKYLLDKDGIIRYRHFGEGDYEKTEQMIQELLKEAGSQVSTQTVKNPSGQSFARTPETYLGYSRLEYLSSPERIIEGQTQTFSIPDPMPRNSFAFQGEWVSMSEYAAPQKGAQLFQNFTAKEVYLVARPKNGTGTMKVFVDDQLQAFGDDVQGGSVTVDSDRLYTLVNLPNPGVHQLRIEFQDSNLEVYAFTFG